jgi:dihydrofolate reductase
MAELTVTTFVTLDGVMQAPGGPTEDTSGDFHHGGWVFPHADADMGSIMVDIFSKADAFLLGRGTYDIFAAHWPRVDDSQDPVASKLNELPKHVASRTRSSFDWHGSTLVQDVATDVAALKKRYPRELQVHGSPGLIQSLIEQDLVDEHRILIFPVVLGTGKRLFGRGAIARAMSLKHSQTTRSGAVYCVYRRAGALKTGSFTLD